MNNYYKRWLFVFNWAKNVQALLDQGYFLWDGSTAFVNGELLIDEPNRYLALRKENCQFMIFDGNVEWDHGAHTPIAQLRKQLEEYKLLKPCSVDLFAVPVISATQDTIAASAYAAFDLLHSAALG